MRFIAPIYSYITQALDELARSPVFSSCDRNKSSENDIKIKGKGEQKMNPKYQVTIAWSQEDECYLVYLPDFADEIMQPVSHGNTYQEALQNGLEVMEELILNLQATGKPLPIAKLISA